jgi:hypothetical protein
MNVFRFVAVAIVAALCCACGGAETKRNEAPVPAAPGDGILFVGNSLTFSNDLPGLVEGLAVAVGRPLRTAMVAFGGYSLEDVIAGVLTGASAKEMPARVVRPGGAELSVPASAAGVLQAAAADAIAAVQLASKLDRVEAR